MDMDLKLFLHGSWSARADGALQVSKFSPYLFWFPSIVGEGEIFVLSEGGIIPLIFTRLTEYDKSDVPNVRAASGLFAKMRFPNRTFRCCKSFRVYVRNHQFTSPSHLSMESTTLRP